MGKLCQYCHKREAKIHFTEIKDGKKTEMHICEQCAHEKNMVLAFPSLLSHIVKGGPAPRPDSEAVPATCPGCGLAYNEFKAKGRLGCPTCYEAFAPVLVPLLEKVHGAAAHTGRAPHRVAGEREAREALAGLEEELTQAVAAEQYEKAAELRDRIREMRGNAEGES
jgi:protein arginine kinase activator